PADVHARVNRGAHDGEESHRFGRTIDRRPPSLPEQIQNRRDERAGMSDADPENEVGDFPRPSDRNIISPNADAGGNEITKAKKTEHCNRARDGETDPPPARRTFLYDAGNPLRDPTKVALVQHQ